jgi:hypothetical protein
MMAMQTYFVLRFARSSHRVSRKPSLARAVLYPGAAVHRQPAVFVGCFVLNTLIGLAMLGVLTHALTAFHASRI